MVLQSSLLLMIMNYIKTRRVEDKKGYVNVKNALYF